MDHLHQIRSRLASSNSLRALWFAAFLASTARRRDSAVHQALASTHACRRDRPRSRIRARLSSACGFRRDAAGRQSAAQAVLRLGSLLYVMAIVFSGKGMMNHLGPGVGPSWSHGCTVPFLGIYPMPNLLPQLADAGGGREGRIRVTQSQRKEEASDVQNVDLVVAQLACRGRAGL